MAAGGRSRVINGPFLRLGPISKRGRHMKIQRTPIASAVALLLMGALLPAQAQVAAPAPAASAPRAETKQLETVIITGIRGSLQQALNQKRNADSLVEVITAEDIGKMPDKN